MSIMGTVNYGNYKLYDETPEWMRLERYEYCEGYSKLSACSEDQGKIRFSSAFIAGLAMMFVKAFAR